MYVQSGSANYDENIHIQQYRNRLSNMVCDVLQPDICAELSCQSIKVTLDHMSGL